MKFAPEIPGRTGHTIESLSRLGRAEEFSYAFRNFLDEFYASPAATPFHQPPAGPDDVRNAYLAATCDYLCNEFLLPRPAWLTASLETGQYIARPPYFASDYPPTRVWLLAESPQEFRQRNLFVGADALSRT